MDREGLGPSVYVGVSSFIAHAYGKLIADTVWRQLVAAGTVKVEHLSVKCLVVWVSVWSTNTTFWKNIEKKRMGKAEYFSLFISSVSF